MKPKGDSPRDIAEYLTRNRAYLVIGVLHVLKYHDGPFRGKVNLGQAAGARGRNDYATRPVQSTKRLGLVWEGFERGACTYVLTELGEKVLAEIDRIES